MMADRLIGKERGRNGGGTLVRSLKSVKLNRTTQVPQTNVRDSQRMASDTESPLLEALKGQAVVIDFSSSYVCLGTLVGWDKEFLEVVDADLHDFRDSQATREVYVFDSARVGIRRNRARVLVKRSDVAAITRFDDIVES
jgi:hypothetical protein